MGHAVCALLFCALTASCTSGVGDSVLEKFRKAGNGLEERTRSSLDSLERELGSLKDPACLAQRAEAEVVWVNGNDLVGLLDTAKSRLSGVEPMNYTFGDSLLERNGLNAQLFNGLTDLYDLASRTCRDDSSRALIRAFSEQHMTYASAEEWHLRNVYHVPQAALVAILNKYALDIRNVQLITFRSLQRHCDTAP